VTQEEIDEAQRRAMAGLGESGAGAPTHPGYVFSQEETEAEEARQAAERAQAPAAPQAPQAPAAPQALQLPPRSALPTERAAAGASSPVGYERIALGREEAALPRRAPPAPAAQPPTGASSGASPGAMPRNNESATGLSDRGAESEGRRQRGRRYSDSGRQTGLMFARILDGIFGGGRHEEEIAGLQAQRPGADAARARAQTRAQQRTEGRSERELSMRERGQQEATARQARADATSARESDPTSEVSRNAQAEVTAMIADAGALDPRMREMLSPARISRMSAAELRDPRDPLIRGLIARTETTARLGRTQENTTQQIGQRFAGEEYLQGQRLASAEQTAAAQRSLQMDIARLHAQRRRGGGGGGGRSAQAGESESVMQDTLRRSLIAGHVDEDLAARIASNTHGRELSRGFNAALAARISSGPTGVQNRNDYTRMAQYHVRNTPIAEQRVALTRARRLVEGASPDDLQGAITALNNPNIAELLDRVGAGNVIPGVHLTPRAIAVAQEIAGWRNGVIRDLSGAQVTPTEFPRILQGIGQGQFNRPEQLLQGLATGEARLNARAAENDASVQDLLGGEQQPDPFQGAGARQRPAQAPAQGGARVAVPGRRYRFPDGRVRPATTAVPLPPGVEEVP